MRRWLTHSADFPRFRIGPGKLLVDIGCGIGAASVAAARAGARVVAVDIEPATVEVTARALREANATRFDAIVSDGQPLPIADNTADLVVCTEVLEHVGDPSAFLAELSRVGKVGARYLISVPAPEAEALMRRVVLPSYFEWPGHLRIYERGSLAVLLQEAGLSVVEEPVYPHGFYWSIYWALGWASGSAVFGPGCPSGDPPLLRAWAKVYNHLDSTKTGDLITEYLDRMVPKSQVIIAQKRLRAKAAAPPSTRGGTAPASPGFIPGLGELLGLALQDERNREPEARDALARFRELLAVAPGGPALVPGLDALPVGAGAWQHDHERGHRLWARARRGRRALRDWAARLAKAG
jgi:SAM-dependent methyltransferase